MRGLLMFVAGIKSARNAVVIAICLPIILSVVAIYLLGGMLQMGLHYASLAISIGRTEIFARMMYGLGIISEWLNMND